MPNNRATEMLWPPHGGAMGALVQAADWAATPLGPLPDWPASLRFAVSLVLGSRVPMMLLWGRECVQIYNDGCLAIQAHRHPAALGRPLREAWHEVWDFVGPIVHRVLDDACPVFVMDQPFLANTRHGRSTFYVTVCYSAVAGDDGRPAGVLATFMGETQRVPTERELREGGRRPADAGHGQRLDIDGHQGAEKRSRDLLARLVAAEETERRRIAREMHDTLGQHLSSLSIYLRLIEQTASLPDEVQVHFERARRAADLLEAATDRLAHTLRPLDLDRLDLPDALAHHARTWARETGVVLELRLCGLHRLRMSEAVETTVYRVMQEALTNVQRHAQASHVRLAIELDERDLRLSLEDDGQGFDLDALASHADRWMHLGMRGMAERASLVNGEFSVNSQPGQGTRVHLRIPLDEQPAAQRPA